MKKEEVDALCASLRAHMKKMKDEERMDLMYALMRGYCRFCGSKYMPCYCQCDD